MAISEQLEERTLVCMKRGDYNMDCAIWSLPSKLAADFYLTVVSNIFPLEGVKSPSNLLATTPTQLNAPLSLS